MKDESAIIAYWNEIQSGGVTVGKWIRLLYEVILQGLSENRWFYDHRLAMNAVGFIERYCHHYKGKLAPRRIRLSLWERASISLIFGIVDNTGKRQYTEVFWVVGRKQGKTLLAGAIGNYMAYAAGEYGSEIYYLAPKLDQADLCYSAFEFNVHAEPELDVITKSTKYRGLVVQETNTIIKKLAFTSKKSDGYNPMFYCADEVAAWPGASGLKQWEVMASGTGAREEPLGMGISSGGYENEGIFDELMKRSTGFLMGNSREKHLLPIIYMIDDAEKWCDLTELEKSLPGLGDSVSVEFIQREIDTANESISKKTEFITKYCNLKQNSSVAWLRAEDIRKAFGYNKTLEDFRNCYALGGIDLSQTTDLTSACVLVEREGIIWIHSHFWLPANRLEEATKRDDIPYQAMIARGLLTASGEEFVDYHDVFDWFIRLVRDYQIYPLQIGYDRYSAQYLVQDLERACFHMESVFQGYNLTGIEDNFEGLLREGKIRVMDDNDLLKIHMMDSAQQIENNTSAHPRKKLVKISKKAHVDGVAAILDAMCMRQNHWAEMGSRLMNEG
ncbi:MAG: terminase large subunit [Clostridia bacterium]|nr:terminase large subunit [Clostridia bacterium]